MAQQLLPQNIDLIPPFPKDHAINKDSLKTQMRPVSSNDLSSGDEVQVPTVISHIPGEPVLRSDPKTVKAFLETELSTPLLDQLHKHLWFFARASGRHVDPLHCQRMWGREIVTVEDAKLHLVWTPDVIYLKPVPECLFNYDFWLFVLAKRDQLSLHERVSWTWTDRTSEYTSEDLRFQATGFLRSYALLIQHRVDFEMAKKNCLISEDISWASWAIFISYFRDIEDQRVSKRYQFGQLRLSRLHWAVFFMQPEAAQYSMFYVLPYFSISSFVSGMFAPFAFLFASITVVLTSMQLLLTSNYTSLDESHFEVAKKISWRLSIFVMVILSFLSIAVFFLIPLFELLRQLRYSLYVNKKRA